MKILWVRLSSMGDVVHTLPAVSELINLGFQVDVLTEEIYQDILNQYQGINNIFCTNIRNQKKSPWKLLKHILQVRDKLKAEKYDAIIDAQGLFKSAIICFKCSEKVIGGDKYSVRERGVSFFYSHKVNINLSANVLNRYRELAINSVKELGVQIKNNISEKPIIFNFSKKFNNSSYQKKIILLHGISKFRRNKQMPIKIWSELAKLIIAEGYQVYTIWDNQDEKIFAEELAKVGVNVLSPKNISEIILDFTDNNQYSAAVSLDSGLGHLVNALGVPNIMLFAPTAARRFNTCYTENQKYLSVEYDCAPCGLRSCKLLSIEEIDKKTPPPCWNSISAEKIFAKLKTIC